MDEGGGGVGEGDDEKVGGEDGGDDNFSKECIFMNIA